MIAPHRRGRTLLCVAAVALSSACSDDELEPGELMWAMTLSSTVERGLYASSVAADTNDDIIVGGAFEGSVDFGDELRPSAGDDDVFVAKLSDGGEPLWSKAFGGNGTDAAWPVATDSADNVWAAGWYQGSVDFGGGAQPGSGQFNGFVVEHSDTGEYMWSQGLTPEQAANGLLVNGLATNPDGSVLVAGNFGGVVNLGDTSLGQAGQANMFLANYAAVGDLVWATAFPISDLGIPAAVAVSPNGTVAVAGYFRGTVDLGAGPVASGGPIKIFTAMYTADGSYVWSREFTSDADVFGFAYSVTATSDDSLVFTGGFEGSLTMEGESLSSVGRTDIVLAKLSSAGELVWAKRFGGIDEDYGFGVAVDDNDNVVVTGRTAGTVDFGGGPMMNRNDFDAFVAKYSPDGAFLWSRSFGGLGLDFGNGVAVDSSANIVVTGNFGNTFDLEAEVADDGGGAFVVKLAR